MSAVGGMLCPDCGASFLLDPCPLCGRATRRTATGRKCDVCGYDSTPMDRETGVPYRSARHALEVFVLHRARLYSARSAYYPKSPDGEGDKRDTRYCPRCGSWTFKGRCGVCGVATRLVRLLSDASNPGNDATSPMYDELADLSAAWDALDPEQRLVLERSTEIPDWQERARKCRKCKHVYGPTGSRCQRCQTTFDLTAPACPRCGDNRAFPVWPMGEHQQAVCPSCGHTGRHAYDHVPGKSEQIARAVTQHRRARFVEDRGREPFKREDGWNEEGLVGMCPRCHTWHTAKKDRVGKYTRDGLCRCKGRIRWGIHVAARSCRGLISAAMGRWSRELKERSLI